MSDGASAPARERWNGRYAEGAFQPYPPAPADWISEHHALLAELAGGVERPQALDVACGDGRNARYLAELGFAVDAVDVSDVAIAHLRSAAGESGLGVRARVLDLESDALPANEYDIVVCMNYLQRDLFAALRAALRPGGLLIFETVARAHVEELGHPFNPAYVLDRNELLGAAGDLHVLHYREGAVDRGGTPRGVASLVARRLS